MKVRAKFVIEIEEGDDLTEAEMKIMEDAIRTLQALATTKDGEEE